MTCDVYRNANTPPAAPDVAAASGTLRCIYPQGYEAGEGGAATQITHIFDCDAAVDIRDGGQTPGSPGYDTLYFPDQNGNISFIVVFVAVIGTVRRCWLRRSSVSYPTSLL